MKKQFLALAAFVLTLQMANAQTEKGKQTLGVNLNLATATQNGAAPSPPYGVSQTQKVDFSTISVGPSYSYFIADNLDLGSAVYYAYAHQKYDLNNSVTDNKTDRYGAYVYLRKYVMYDNKIGFRTGPRVGYEHSGNKNVYSYSPSVTNTSNDKSQTFSGAVLFDMVYYPSSKIGLTATLGTISYNHTKSTSANNDVTTSDSFGLNFINNALSFSVFYTFGGK